MAERKDAAPEYFGKVALKKCNGRYMGFEPFKIIGAYEQSGETFLVLDNDDHLILEYAEVFKNKAKARDAYTKFCDKEIARGEKTKAKTHHYERPIGRREDETEQASGGLDTPKPSRAPRKKREVQPTKRKNGRKKRGG